MSNILPFLLECQNEIEASEHIRRLAQRLTIDEGLIAEEYRKAARRGGRQQTGQPTVIPEEKSAGIGQQAEELLLRLLLEQPQLCDECRAEVKETGFEDAVLAQLFDRLCELGTAYTTDKLNNVLDDAAQTAVAYGRAQAWVGGAAAALQNFFNLSFRQVRILADFTGEITAGPYFSCKIGASPIIMITAALYALVQLKNEHVL